MDTAERKKLVAMVNSRLREEWGISIASIDESRLFDEIARCRHGDITIKIPSRSEFEMSFNEAEAVLAELKSWRWKKF